MLQALNVALKTDGPRGLFRGTIPLLSREVPFYVVGMTGYAYLKTVANGRSIDLFQRLSMIAPKLSSHCLLVEPHETALSLD